MSSTTVDKALAVLGELSASETQVGVSELGRRLGLTRSAVHRLLGSLVKAGLVQQDPLTRKYSLGRETVRLGYSAIYSDPLLRTALPYLHYLAAQVGEAAFLAERLGYHAAPVLQVLPPSLRKELGWYTREPLHSTSTGKVLLAYAEEHELLRVLNNGLAPRTEYTITDPLRLREELAIVREAGFATSFEEERLGINAVAVPLREPEGTVVAALALAGRAYSLTREKAAASLEQLKAIAAEITNELRDAR